MSETLRKAGDRLRVAVVGHVEWVEFLRVERVPVAGEIVEADTRLSIPAGGGAVAAVHLARWGAEAHFFTALGDDALGRRAHDELAGRRIHMHAVFRAEPQRRAITFVDAQRERTIVTIGPRLVPHAGDDLDWDVLDRCDAVYVTGGDVGAVKNARRARVLVGTSRVTSLLRAAGVELDALVGSANDPSERYAPGDLDPAPRLVVRTDGARGGEYAISGGAVRRFAAEPAVVRGDTYGAGDAFAAALTYALGAGEPPDRALAWAASRAVELLSFDGPYPAGG